MSNEHEAVTASVIEDVTARLAANKRVRQVLPGGGILHMDRLLPFLCIYRRNPARRDEGTARLVMSEAAYLCAPGLATHRNGLRKLIQAISETAIKHLGAFMVLEIWTSDDRQEKDEQTGEISLPRAEFRIQPRRPHRPNGTVVTMGLALQQIRVHRRSAKVQIELKSDNHPAGMTELMSESVETEIGCHVLGLEVRPIFRDPASGDVCVRVAGSFGRQLSLALKKSFFAFALNRTDVRPQHYFALGTSRLAKQALTVDHKLAELSREFKFLLLVTPINAERSWASFVESKFRKEPSFQYRPLNQDPFLLKRRLMNIRTEKVDNPTLAYIFRQTQSELDRQITMLADVGTKCFLPGSLQVFDGVDSKLEKLARNILETTRKLERDSEAEMVDAAQFAQLAQEEIRHYQTQSPSFNAQATIRDDIFSGLLVAGSELLIGNQTRINRHRANALLQHEVGTHLVTYFNGANQPLRLLQVGLAGYDAMQEGLAVLSEYLVGGLTVGRLRTLAARVIAVDQMIQGKPFTDVFAQLVDEFGFEARTAYTITLRVFRGGGLTKDSLYLQGLVEIIDYIAKDGDLEPLLVGKIAVEHVPMVKELLLCGVLKSPPLRPRYLDDPIALQRLEAINSETTVLGLIENADK